MAPPPTVAEEALMSREPSSSLLPDVRPWILSLAAAGLSLGGVDMDSNTCVYVSVCVYVCLYVCSYAPFVLHLSCSWMWRDPV